MIFRPIQVSSDEFITTLVAAAEADAADRLLQISTLSEMTRHTASVATDDESLDGLVIVDDVQTTQMQGISQRRCILMPSTWTTSVTVAAPMMTTLLNLFIHLTYISHRHHRHLFHQRQHST